MAGCANSSSVVEEEPLSARLVALLTPHTHPDLVIEFSYFEGVEPDPAAVEFFVSTVHEVVDKRGIRIAGPAPITAYASRTNWTDADLRRLHAATLDVRTTEDEAVYHVLYVPGEYAGESAWGLNLGDVSVLFAERIREGAGRIVNGVEADLSYVESRVLVHEFGHAMGLVNHGLPMVVARQADGSHSDRPKSVMHTHADGWDVLLFTDGRPVSSSISRSFDEHDLADIRTFQQRAAAAFAQS